MKSTPSPYPTTDPTADWKTFRVSALDIIFKLPPEMATQVGEFKESVIPGEIGTLLSVTSKSPLLSLGTTSTDYQEGRGGAFSDLQGFIKTNGSYSAKFVQGKSFTIPSNFIKEVDNDNFEIIRILGQNYTTGDYLGPVEGTPGEGKVGALINVPSNENYTGLTVEMKLESEFTTALFDQILTTFKFSASPVTTQRACTLEAKICPDGSSVGRTGPNCEFAQCP
jgi:hypothetical protein